MAAAFSSVCAVFQSTHPVRGATAPTCAPHRAPRHFNPRTPCGVRQWTWNMSSSGARFQSTHPVRGATAVGAVIAAVNIISIHAPRAGCDEKPIEFYFEVQISIHAPRAGCDIYWLAPLNHAPISIHAPRAGCDVLAYRGACGSRISIHAPRAGCDAVLRLMRGGDNIFQSTHPVRGATQPHHHSTSCIQFQSTHPVRGATSPLTAIIQPPVVFQSTHPVRGATPQAATSPWMQRYFNPRTPCGVRPCAPAEHRRHGPISIHAPRAGCDPAASPA